MRLMARPAVHLDADLRNIVNVHLVLHGVFIYRVSKAVLNRQYRNDVEVLVWKPYFALEDRYYLLALNLLRFRLWPMTLQAEAVHIGGP